MVEVVIATVIFVIVATGLVGLLVSSTSITTLAKERTLAEQGVNNQVEKIRAGGYDNAGTVDGNPGGSIPKSAAFTGVNGESLGVGATMTTHITYAGANVPGAAVTNADQKKIEVTITRDRDSKVLAHSVTYLAPTQRASQTTATIDAKVIDYGDNLAVPGVQVHLSTGPSAPAGDTTDSDGDVTFAGLQANPTSGSQAYYDLSVDPPSGYVALSDSSATHVQLSPTQAWSTVLDVYKPVTIDVALQNEDSTPFTGTAYVTVSSPRPSPGGTSTTFTYSGSPITVTTLSPPDGELLVPNLTYSITVTAGGYETVDDSAGVPSGTYPTSLGTTFTETMVPAPPGELDVTVHETKSSRYGSSTITCTNATVDVTGGPDGVNLSSGTDSSGVAAFPNLTAGGPPTGYSISASSATSGLSNGASGVTVVEGPGVTNVTVNLGSSRSSSC
jgi:Tfp pilus assembly protein PilV